MTTEIIGPLLDMEVLNRYSHERIVPGEHPSSPSSTVNKKGVGYCQRQLWYRHQYPPKHSASTLHIFQRGCNAEKVVQHYLANCGIVVGTNIKWSSFPLGGSSFDNDLFLSGEADILIASPTVEGEAYIVECKTYTHEKAGWSAASLGIIELGYVKPKGAFHNTKYLLQAMIYQSQFAPQVKEYKVVGTILMYIDASNFANRKEFLIQLQDNETLIVDGQHYPEWKASSIFKKMDKIRKQRSNMTKLPKRDYIPIYSPEQVEALHSSGDIGVTKYRNYKSGKIATLGEFECDYCEFRQACLDDSLTVKGCTKSTPDVDLGDM
jgi:hypothetical protein